LHLILDTLVLVGSMALAAGLHGWLRERFELLRDTPPFGAYALLVYLAVPLWLTLIIALGLHRSFERAFTYGELFVRILKLQLFGVIGLLVIQFLTQAVINRSLVLMFWSSAFGLLYAERVLLASWVRYQHGSGQSRMQVLLVGRLSQRMADFIADAQAQPLPPHFIGYLRAPLSSDVMSVPPEGMVEVECLGALDDLPRVLHERPVDHVMFFPPTNRPEELQAALTLCEELAVTASFAINLKQVARARPRLISVYQHPFVAFELAPKRPEALALKGVLDVVAAALLVVIAAPLMLAIALAILLTMGRPVLFVQTRAGLHARPFRMLKFRTMVHDAEQRRSELQASNEMGGPVFKIRNDARITALGRMLRKSSLDELPQLFNVLTGSMSLVGPRPLPLKEQDGIHGWQRRRLSMKPGITGLWQTSGRSQLDFEEWMLLDLKYVDEWSLWLDILILLRTVPVVLFGRGAY
jgi:exopolysaccharide biosynthesis polyprenyl glycosylphosphotransferase